MLEGIWKKKFSGVETLVVSGSIQANSNSHATELKNIIRVAAVLRQYVCIWTNHFKNKFNLYYSLFMKEKCE